MGVDVMFYIEARQKSSGKWHYVKYKQFDPGKEEAESSQEDDVLDDGIWLGRYYHISDSLQQMPSHRFGLPDDCSNELRNMFNRQNSDDDIEDCGGWDIYSVSYIDIVETCDKLEKELLDAFYFIATTDVVKRLDRIECILKGEDPAVVDEREYNCNYSSMTKALEDFKYDNCGLFRLKKVVDVLVTDYSEIRLIYVLC